MYNLAAAAGLLDGIVSGKLLLPNLIEEFKLNRFSEPLAEFNVTQTLIYMLGCLLGECWAEEDVLNACAEMIYYRQAALFLDEEPSFSFLPTSFFNNCRILVALPHAPDNLLLCYVVQNGWLCPRHSHRFVPWDGAANYEGRDEIYDLAAVMCVVRIQ
jgi:hypothetical protein